MSRAVPAIAEGIDLLDRDQVRAMYPWLNFDNARFPIKGALMQRRGISGGKVAKWAPGNGFVVMGQTLRRLRVSPVTNPPTK